MLAFAQALTELRVEGGIGARAARYRRNHQVLLEGLSGLGIQPYLKREVQSHIITAFTYPSVPGFSFPAFYRGLSERGFSIYPAN